MDKVLIIDGMNFIHRANISFSPRKVIHTLADTSLINTEVSAWNDAPDTSAHCLCKAAWNMEEGYCYGERYALIFVFFRNLRAMIEILEPQAIFFTLEGKNNFRYKLFPQYKANRLIKEGEGSTGKQAAKDAFNVQANLIIDLLPLLPIVVASAEGFEADDVVASLVDNMKDEEVVIASNDTDFIQLLQKGYANLKLYSPTKKEYLQPPAYFYLPWKVLRGDKSDNIPNLVGEKKALKIVNDPKMLEDFLQESEENRANFNRNRDLIQLQVIPMEEIKLIDFNTNLLKLKEEFARMKFDSLLQDDYWKRFVETFDLSA